MKKLIKEYQKKIEKCDRQINRITELIRLSRKDSSIDTDDLREEKANCNRDRQLYVQFIHDLDDIE